MRLPDLGHPIPAHLRGRGYWEIIGWYVTSAAGPIVTLAANICTQLTVAGIRPGSTAAYAPMELNFSASSAGTVSYWDDLALSSS